MNPIEARKLFIRTYQETGNISETACLVKYFDLFHGARRWHTSRQLVRKWARRFQEEGGLKDRSRSPRVIPITQGRPHHSPRQTPPEIEDRVMEARKATRYGRETLALYLQRGAAFGLSSEAREQLRRQMIAQFGEALELIAPANEDREKDSSRKRKKRRGRK